MAEEKVYEKKLVVPLRDHLNINGVKNVEFARHNGVTPVTVSRILASNKYVVIDGEVYTSTRYKLTVDVNE